MITIIKQEEGRRWDTLPMKLREAMCSETNSAILWRVCEAEHIPENKIFLIARVVAYVMMGFLHPEEMKREFQDQAGLNPQLADTIANSLISRLFGNLKDDLEAVYAPPGKPEAAPIVEEIKPPETVEETAKGIKEMPVEIFKDIKQIIPEVKPSPLPEEKLKPIIIEPSGETSSPAPIFIHKETEFKPLSRSFRIEIPRPGAAGPARPSTEQLMKPAQLEIGKPPEPPKKPTVARTEISPPRVVHYTQWKTPFDKATEMKAGSGPVPLSELAASGPKSAEQPKPAAAPAQPSATPKPKTEPFIVPSGGTGAQAEIPAEREPKPDKIGALPRFTPLRPVTPQSATQPVTRKLNDILPKKSAISEVFKAEPPKISAPPSAPKPPTPPASTIDKRETITPTAIQPKTADSTIPPPKVPLPPKPPQPKPETPPIKKEPTVGGQMIDLDKL